MTEGARLRRLLSNGWTGRVSELDASTRGTGYW